MRVGFVGLGKLGLPVALAVESKGHDVVGYDVSPAAKAYVSKRHIPYREEGAGDLLASTRLQVGDTVDVVDGCDVVFVAVQTPHDPLYEGVTRLPAERADFDYTHLVDACRAVFNCLTRPTVVAVISTVLPGTMDRLIRPMVNENVRLVYTPQFIAMGTTVADFLSPEFTLLGVDDPTAADVMERFFGDMTGRPVFRTDIATAEGIKVFYNTFITAKTVLGNLYGELAERCGMNVDDIHAALSMADRRLMSPAYLKAGVGDGGGCHPRDNIALSWLAREKGLSFDLFESLMLARERHMEWIADEVIAEHERSGLPVVVWGWSFKPRTNIVTGSPARLLHALLVEKGVTPERVWDPHAVKRNMFAGPLDRSVIVIATDHGDWPPAPAGSIVIDPFGTYPDVPAVKVRRLGRSKIAGVGSLDGNDSAPATQ
jgi:UDPglucose 6-dehydrogenase